MVYTSGKLVYGLASELARPFKTFTYITELKAAFCNRALSSESTYIG